MHDIQYMHAIIMRTLIKETKNNITDKQYTLQVSTICA